MSPSTLLLFSGSYPYSIAAEDTFLSPEIEQLQRAFDRVILVPASLQGTRAAIPAGIEVVEAYARVRERLRMRRAVPIALHAREFYREVVSSPGILADRHAVLRAISFVAAGEVTRDWLVGWLRRWRLDPARTVCYSYWFWDIAWGLTLTKRLLPGLHVVSRAHGFDLYLERHRPAYIPARAAALRGVDRLFPVSLHGELYLKERYPATSVLRVARLGVRDPEFRTVRSEDGKLRIVSCSSLIPVKRVGLLVRGLADLARLAPGMQIEWHHLGGGAMLEEVKAFARGLLPEAVRWRVMGQMAPGCVMRHYRDHPVDVLVNVSESEGVPVSIMEAIACGIPVLATAVGGTPEVVTERSGRLLRADPTSEEIAAALLEFSDPEFNAALRAGAREEWAENYNGPLNHARFAAELAVLVREGGAPGPGDA